MDREQAIKALDVLRTVVGQARDDTALQNWGVIWMLHAFTVAGGFIATNVLLWSGHEEPWPYATMWATIVVFNIATVFALKKRRAGARSFVEGQLWSIWLTFVAAVSLLAILNHLMGLRTFYLGPVIGVLAAVSFATMGALMGRRWYIATAVFAVASVAMALAPDHQFIVLGVTWGAAQFTGGAMLHRDRARRLGGGRDDGPRLV